MGGEDDGSKSGLTSGDTVRHGFRSRFLAVCDLEMVMTHYEQCCARECPWCAKGWPKMTDGRHIAPLSQPYDCNACTASTLAEFAERCAVALEPFVKYHNRRMEITNHALESVTENGGVLKAEDWDAARRALGFGGLTCVKKQ